MLAKKRTNFCPPPTEIVFSPDEVFDTYAEFSEDLHIDANTYYILSQKANPNI